MEQILTLWIDDLNQKRIPLSQPTIIANTDSLLDEIHKKECENETFTASKGWFARIKATIANSLLKN